MNETWYEKREREAGEELERLLARPMASTGDVIGAISETTNEPEYFDPWDMFPCLYGSYSSVFDDMALEVFENMLNGNRKDETLAHEMFREILCNKNLCDYGTSPRVCFPTSIFKKLLPEYLSKWKEYYQITWGKNSD